MYLGAPKNDIFNYEPSLLFHYWLTVQTVSLFIYKSGIMISGHICYSRVSFATVKQWNMKLTSTSLHVENSMLHCFHFLSLPLYNIWMKNIVVLFLIQDPSFCNINLILKRVWNSGKIVDLEDIKLCLVFSKSES